MIHDNAWTLYDEKELSKLEKLSKDYMDFLDKGKTERECTKLLVEMAKENGYRDLEDVIKSGDKLGFLEIRVHSKSLRSFPN